jgi:hypothetical protein
VVAGGGIGWLIPYFQTQYELFPEQFQVTLSLFSLTVFNPLTEGFTEGFSGRPPQ